MIGFDSIHIFNGVPTPLGISFHNNWINFALYAKNISELSLCLFDGNHKTLLHEIPLDPLRHRTGDIWHIQIKNLPQHLAYAYRTTLHAITMPQLLLDPYARVIASNNDWGTKQTDSLRLAFIPEESDFNWEDDRHPKTPWKNSIIYEMHVRGFTKHSSSKVQHPGTYMGVIEKIPHLLQLGVTAIELLPVHEFNENEYAIIHPNVNHHLYNYWGYSTINFFSPMKRYASSNSPFAAQTEFKTMVKALHKHGIEVILDVVFNHTAEGIHLNRLFSYRGLDPQAYYINDGKGNSLDFTGCGNTFNCNHPIVQEIIIQSLRFWVSEMHVDGFRFDLASVFARDMQGNPLARPPILDAITLDPLLSQTKLIAEPWEAGGLYQSGSFALPHTAWSEWNDRYRDDVRSFIKGDQKSKNLFATRLSGSQDLYGKKRTPCASINFITCHDGFTLADLVSYNHKHNANNCEGNKDGTNNNMSWNCGVEGPTHNKMILKLRKKQMKNFHLALMISQGVPMLLMGDEYGHTKEGNNNTWCQDNALNWFLWDKLEGSQDFYRFYRLMIQFRKQHPQLHKGQFLTEKDIIWHGTSPFLPEWQSDNKFIAFTIKDPERHHDLFIAFNAQHQDVNVTLPPNEKRVKWYQIVDTNKDSPMDFCEEHQAISVPSTLVVASHSAIILKQCP